MKRLDLLPPAPPPACRYLDLDVLDANEGFLVLESGLLVAALLVEHVALAVEQWHGLQPLFIAQRPGLALVLAWLLHLREPSRSAGGLRRESGLHHARDTAGRGTLFMQILGR